MVEADQQAQTSLSSGSTVRAMGTFAGSFASSQSVGEERKEGLLKEDFCMGWARISVHPFYSHSVVRDLSWGHSLLPGRLKNGV